MARAPVHQPAAHRPPLVGPREQGPEEGRLILDMEGASRKNTEAGCHVMGSSLLSALVRGSIGL